MNSHSRSRVRFGYAGGDCEVSRAIEQQCFVGPHLMSVLESELDRCETRPRVERRARFAAARAILSGKNVTPPHARRLTQATLLPRCRTGHYLQPRLHHCALVGDHMPIQFIKRPLPCWVEGSTTCRPSAVFSDRVNSDDQPATQRVKPPAYITCHGSASPRPLSTT